MPRKRGWQRGQSTTAYLVVIALGLVAIWGAWGGLALAIADYYERFAFAIGLPVT